MKNYFKLLALVLKAAPAQAFLKIMQALISAAALPLSMYATRRLIDAVAALFSNGVNIPELFIWGGALVFSLFFVSVGDGFLNQMINIALKRKINDVMTPFILNKFNAAAYACFEEAAFHDTISRMSNDPQEKIRTLFIDILNVIKSFLALIGASLIFASAGWWYTAVFFVLFTPTAFLNFKVEDILGKLYDEQSVSERRLDSLKSLVTDKRPLFELRIFGARGYILGRWRKLSDIVLDERLKTNIRAQKCALAAVLLMQIWSFFLVIGLAFQLANREINVGMFTTLIASTGGLLEAAGTLSWLARDFRENSLLLKHFFKFMTFPDEQYGPVEMIGELESIAFEHVSFTYPGSDMPVLKDVSFLMRAHEHVALVGSNSAGKSTTIKLLCGLYKPDSGRILINGMDIRTLSRAALQRLFSAVFQDFCHYELTLRENVALGNIAALNDDARLFQAITEAEAGMRDLDAPLGRLEEGGTDLSGGEWQRIAIARALASDSRFLILDEPTASLDPVAESNLYNRFMDMMARRGCIIVSHRLASAKNADRIVVLKEGVMIENGSHAELMARHGLYAEMFSLQSAWYTKEAEA